jgi:O-acetyl-ADP-ribose deacetylase (regulator of RNase III)
VKADAIVSPTTSCLAWARGVSAVLDARSGFVLQHEVKKFERVRHGGVVTTVAGDLRARPVFHAVTID